MKPIVYVSLALLPVGVLLAAVAVKGSSAEWWPRWIGGITVGAAMDRIAWLAIQPFSMLTAAVAMIVAHFV